MLTYFQKRFALSREGARSLIKGIFWTSLLDIALMLPAVFTFFFLEDYLQGATHHGALHYAALGAAFMAVLFSVAMVQYANTYTAVYTESANRRISLAEKLRRLPLAFFGEKNLSDLTATLMEDNTMLETFFSHSIPQLFASIISLLFIAAGLFFYDWRLALALFWVVPVAALVVFLAKRSMGKEFKSNYHIKREVAEQIQEGIEEIQEIKAYNGEGKYMQQLGRCLEAYERSLIGGELLTGVWLNFSYIILKLGLASVILTGAYLVMAGTASFFTYLIFLMIGASIYNPVSEVFNNMALLSFFDIRIGRMREMEAMPIQHGKRQFTADNFDITFQHVDFAYQEGKQVLHDVSFTARQGQVTALVGPSGGGKSTSAKLAARFWDIGKGRILLGGQDIAGIDPETLLRYYAIVFQDVMLFNATVEDNIRVGKPGATVEEIRRAARLAQCEEFIERLPEGYRTFIGENGERLSGGERQRISIARALLKDAPVILLDEATASLDVENETKIQAAISELIKNKTVLIIAHRMRTVANAHKIVVLKDGTVAEQGPPAELMAAGGEFARMVAKQGG